MLQTAVLLQVREMPLFWSKVGEMGVGEQGISPGYKPEELLHLCALHS